MTITILATNADDDEVYFTEGKWIKEEGKAQKFESPEAAIKALDQHYDVTIRNHRFRNEHQ